MIFLINRVRSLDPFDPLKVTKGQNEVIDYLITFRCNIIQYSQGFLYNVFILNKKIIYFPSIKG